MVVLSLHLEVFAEVNLASFWVIGDFFCIAMLDNASLKKDIRTIYNAKGFTYIMIRDEDGETVCLP